MASGRPILGQPAAGQGLASIKSVPHTPCHDGDADGETRMALSLNHINIRTLDLDATERFYCQVLGLIKGPRPAFEFPGAWLYTEDTSHYSKAVVHVSALDAANPGALKQYLGERDAASLTHTGSVDHVAFFATGLADTRSRLVALDVASRERTVPGLGLHQVFVTDPNGVVVELNFPAEEA